MGRLHSTASLNDDLTLIRLVQFTCTRRLMSFCRVFALMTAAAAAAGAAIWRLSHFSLFRFAPELWRMDTSAQQGQINWKLQFPRSYWEPWPTRFVSLSINRLAAYSKPIYLLYHECANKRASDSSSNFKKRRSGAR